MARTEMIITVAVVITGIAAVEEIFSGIGEITVPANQNSAVIKLYEIKS